MVLKMELRAIWDAFSFPDRMLEGGSLEEDRDMLE